MVYCSVIPAANVHLSLPLQQPSDSMRALLLPGQYVSFLPSKSKALTNRTQALQLAEVAIYTRRVAAYLRCHHLMLTC